jgi:hypothetical protein
LQHKYYDIISQEIANKLLDISSTLSPTIAKQMLKKVMEQLCGNELDREKYILSLLRKEQREYYINMLNAKHETAEYLSFLLLKTYL